jgi:hypothetical protein
MARQRRHWGSGFRLRRGADCLRRRPATGNFLGALKDGTGKVITNPGLWALVFRNDGVGDPNTLYFTAGPNREDRGLFGASAFHN